jgi:hypothetical protein
MRMKQNKMRIQQLFQRCSLWLLLDEFIGF